MEQLYLPVEETQCLKQISKSVDNSYWHAYLYVRFGAPVFHNKLEQSDRAHASIAQHGR